MPELNIKQQKALDDAARENQSTGKVRADHMTYGTLAENAVEAEQSWLDGLGTLSGYMQRNALSALNQTTMECATDPVKRRVLSPDGFEYGVRYVHASPGSYIPWTKDVDREVKQVVLHSFGHQWHAFKSSGKWRGALNEVDAPQWSYDPQEFGEDGVARKIWLPKGTDPERGFTNWNRFTATLRSLIQGSSGTTGVHYLIARNGDLYVLTDANDIVGSCGVFNDTAIAIGLEEALYLDYHFLYDGRPPATWLPGGDPPGTAGTVQYFPYSEQQYSTLSILMRKLGNAIPVLKTKVNSLGKIKSPSSFQGFTMHRHLPEARPENIDVSPHLQGQRDWDLLYLRVSKQSSVDQYSTWYTQQRGFRSRLRWVEEAVEALGPDPDTAMTGVTVNPAVNILLGVYRSHQEILRGPGSYRAAAAANAEAEAKTHTQRKGLAKTVEAAAAAPTAVPNISEEAQSSAVPLYDSRQGSVDTAGILQSNQVGAETDTA